jgi:hypothetical protein
LDRWVGSSILLRQSCLQNLTLFPRTNIGNAKILGLQSDLGLSAYVSAVTSFPPHATQPTPSSRPDRNTQTPSPSSSRSTSLQRVRPADSQLCCYPT